MGKVAGGAVVLRDADSPRFFIYFWIAAFCNQLVGIFPIEELLMDRIFAFVFGGTDAIVQVEERFLIDLYKANLMKHIWQSDNSQLSLSNKCALLFKLDDDDLQQLILEEDYGQKSVVIGSVYQHMKAYGLHGHQDW